jgi:hypothetical protein
LIRKFFKNGVWEHRYEDAVALAALAVFFVAMFPQPLFGGKYIFIGDGFFYSYPLRTVAWLMIRHGELPLWTPYIMSGYPLLSMAQIGLGYPLTWGYLFLPGRVAEQIYVLAPFFLTPIFTYAYLRELGRSSLASLFGALTFGYGGLMASPAGNYGGMQNAVIWLPLVLIGLERVRRRPFVPSVLAATGAYVMSVLSGFGQGFLSVGLLAAFYSVFLTFQGNADSRSVHTLSELFRRARPLAVAVSAILLAIGVAAFQIMETAQAIKLSVRNVLTYEIFAQGSFTPTDLVRSMFEPLFYVVDVTAYVPPLALALACVAVYVYWGRRSPERDARVVFWSVIAVAALILMLGQHTPLYRLVYYTPLLNRFRIPSRHAFEWTFAVGVLAAYGWDAVTEAVRARRLGVVRSSLLTREAAVVLLLAAGVMGAVWWLRVQTLQLNPVFYAGSGAPQPVYLMCKLIFLLLTLGALWRAALISSPHWRKSLVLVTLLVLCYVEPSALIRRWWGGASLRAERFTAVSDATRCLGQFSPTAGRVYTRVDLMSEQFSVPPRFDAANLSAVSGLHNVAGYEPLILERYSRALGGVGLDSVHTFTAYAPDPTIMGGRSRVLDILNTNFVISYSGLATSLEGLDVSNSGTLESLGELPPQTTKTFNAPPSAADALQLVTSLANSVTEPQGATVAQLRIFTTDGRTFERELRAGVDTAEWAHERPDVRDVVKHQLAPVFEATKVTDAGGFSAYRYQTQLPLDRPTHVSKVEITNVSRTAYLALFGVRLLDTVNRRAAPLAPAYADKWQPVYEQRETLILRNTRAQPRAWLVTHAEAVDSAEALARIRGESQVDFDPARTVLLEVKGNDLPHLSAGVIPPESTVQIQKYEPTYLQLETNVSTETVLVISEIFYPGWQATVDGQPARIMIADYLLRAVTLPAGKHTVEMRYLAPAASRGAIVSLLTLCLIVGLTIYARVTRVRNRELTQ